MRDEQLRMALEANPEAFISVPMLYVQATLNDVAVKAFVDTGAQMTVMNLDMAQRCKLGALIDQRFRGVAAGVGAARIVGRVHLATLRFGRSAVDTTITVLEQRSGPDLLLGLDVRPHSCGRPNQSHPRLSQPPCVGLAPPEHAPARAR